MDSTRVLSALVFPGNDHACRHTKSSLDRFFGIGNLSLNEHEIYLS
jgi:hypothetical protein